MNSKTLVGFSLLFFVWPPNARADAEQNGRTALIKGTEVSSIAPNSSDLRRRKVLLATNLFGAGAASVTVEGALPMAFQSFLPAEPPTAKGQFKSSMVSRTPEGKPDLQGVWTNSTLTPLERSKEFAGKPSLTDAEASAWEKHFVQERKKYDGKSEKPFGDGASGSTGGYNLLFIDSGSELARVEGVKRTSLIAEPPDGKVPRIRATPNGPSELERSLTMFDSAKDRPLPERCLVGSRSTSGPPMLPGPYNNTYQIVQTPDHVVILVEMIHDARIIRMNATHAPSTVRQWFGDSIGHWEGDTLVVDTTNFTEKTRFQGSSENLHVIERFTRIESGAILYKATIEDPATFTKAWTIELPFIAAQGPVYEYACHEGNYAITDILGGARKAEQEDRKE